MELVDYTDADLPLSLALETDPVVMAELNGPRPVEAIERVHVTRANAADDGGLWLKIVVDGDDTGTIGAWRSENQGEQVWEVGWMLLRGHIGRGLGSEALGLLIERLRAAERYDRVHAFPGVTNGASNALCRKHGFELIGTEEAEFNGAPLTYNHWVLETGSAD